MAKQVAQLLENPLGLTDTVRAIPIVKPEVTHSIGLVVPQRSPLTPLINALVSEAKQLAAILSSDTPSQDGDILRTVRSWRYHPALCNGVPTEAETRVEFSSR